MSLFISSILHRDTQIYDLIPYLGIHRFQPINWHAYDYVHIKIVFNKWFGNTRYMFLFRSICTNTLSYTDVCPYVDRFEQKQIGRHRYINLFRSNKWAQPDQTTMRRHPRNMHTCTFYTWWSIGSREFFLWSHPTGSL